MEQSCANIFLPSHSTGADSVRLGRPLGLALVQWMQPTPRRRGGVDCHHPAVNQKAFPGSLVLETHLTIDSYLVCKDCKAASFRWESEQVQRSRTWGNTAWRMGTSFLDWNIQVLIDWLIDWSLPSNTSGWTGVWFVLHPGPVSPSHQVFLRRPHKFN